MCYLLLCLRALCVDSEFWEVRNKAIVAIKTLVTQAEKTYGHNIQDIITINVLRMLKDPIKNMVCTNRVCLHEIGSSQTI
jgi:hypothetical protein